MLLNHLFGFFESPESAHLFCEYTFCKYQSINFTFEHENNCSLSFLDVKICRKNRHFVTTVYRKPLFSEVSPVWKVSFNRPKERSFRERLLYRSVKICCVFKTLQLEIDHLKNIIRKISYLLTFIDSFRVLIYLLKNCIHVKSLFRMCLKGVSFR